MRQVPPPHQLPEPILEKPKISYAKNELNRQRGRSLWFRVKVEGMSTLTAWRQVFPNSIANDRSVVDPGAPVGASQDRVLLRP